MGLHVSTVQSHLQALVYQIYTKNALRIVGSPTLTILYFRYCKRWGIPQCVVHSLGRGLVHEGLKMTQQSRNMQPHYHIICLILPLSCLTELHPPFISQTLRDGTPKVQKLIYVLIAQKGLTFRKRASYIQDGHTANLQMLHFIYLFNKCTYCIF